MASQSEVNRYTDLSSDEVPEGLASLLPAGLSQDELHSISGELLDFFTALSEPHDNEEPSDGIT